MADLVTLAQAKKHLRLPLVGSHEDDDLYAKLAQAHAMVLDYVNQRRDDDTWADTVAAWTDETAPKQVTAAILTMVGVIYRFRGDDEEAPKWSDGHMPPMVRMMLDRLRDPAVA
jgi:hypothetical protein